MAGLTQAAQRPAHRPALRCGQVVLARLSDPMGLFRGVDENEEHRERSGREARRFRWQGAGAREERVQVRCPRDALLARSEEHTSELQSQSNLVCRLLLEKKKA